MNLTFGLVLSAMQINKSINQKIKVFEEKHMNFDIHEEQLKNTLKLFNQNKFKEGEDSKNLLFNKANTMLQEKSSSGSEEDHHSLDNEG